MVFFPKCSCWFQMDAADECTIGDHPVFLIAELAENLLHTVICPRDVPRYFPETIFAFRKNG